MKLLLRLSLILTALASVTFADVVTLKSGEKLDGKITADTPASVTIEVKVSAGINDERVVPRAEVAKVEKTQPDAAAYAPLQAIKLGLNSLPAPQYDPLLNPLRGFLTQFPNSAHAGEIKKNFDEIEAEKKRVEDGEVKLNGKWLGKEEVQKERYQINAQIAVNYMRDQRTRGSHVGVLNAFDQLEKNYPGARAFPDAVELARQSLTELNSYVTRQIPQQKFAAAEKQKGIEQAGPAQQAQLQAAVEREQAQDEAVFAAAERAQQPWPPLIPRSEKSLTALAAKIPGEIQRLSEQPIAKMRQSIQLNDKGKTHLGSKEFDAAEAALTQAIDLWPANELTGRLQAQLSEAKAGAPPAPSEPDAAMETAPAAVTATASDSAPGAQTSEPLEPQDDPKPFYTTPAGIISILGGLVLVLVALNIFKKIKARSNEAVE